MATKIPTPIVHSYTEIYHVKFAREWHYKLSKVVNGTAVLPETIRISEVGKSEKSKPFYCLTIWDGRKWKIPAVTGLFKTNIPGIFKNDSHRKKNLIILKFGNDQSQINISYLKDFYTNDLEPPISSTVS